MTEFLTLESQGTTKEKKPQNIIGSTSSQSEILNENAKVATYVCKLSLSDDVGVFYNTAANDKDDDDAPAIADNEADEDDVFDSTTADD